MSFAEFLNFIMHLNNSLPDLINQYHNVVYLILFFVIFCETGLVVTPFLPGDSLIFATATVIAMGKLNPWVILPMIFCASVLGDNVNFRIGHFLSDRVQQ
ncbi:MAG: cytochrome O ubiquinol oxidase, partial [Clostridia bacterium]|nr:cytochrome O ubiquinol oxidase [Clostridia bacterium]